MNAVLTTLCLAVLCAASPSSAGTNPIPLEAFAAVDAITDASISPDGRYVAEVRSVRSSRGVFVIDRLAATDGWKPILRSSDNQFDISWCRWATNTRLLCSFVASSYLRGYRTDISRLVAVDANGSHVLVLFDDLGGAAGGAIQDRIIDWHPGIANSVLVEVEESVLSSSERSAIAMGAQHIGQTTSGSPAIFALDVNTGATHLVMHSASPAIHFLTDLHGTPRLGYGLDKDLKSLVVFSRSADGERWTRLQKAESLQPEAQLRPVALNAYDPNRVYAVGDYLGHGALWSIDLTDRQPPQMLSADSSVDIRTPLRLSDGRLIGVAYDTDRRHNYYLDPRVRELAQTVDQKLPDTSNLVSDASTDLNVLLIHASSDVEPGAYYLFDAAQQRLLSLGRANSFLDPKTLGRMLPISFPARDGTAIPGFVTKPAQAKDGRLPMVVLVHGGPAHRDVWAYSYLAQFLVSRGYAVLQINFRGSIGFGHAWFQAAHEDWGGLSYDDIVDGVQWAIKSGLADPENVGIVGWDYGGYTALVAARDAHHPFRFAISINGVSDLRMPERPYGLRSVLLSNDGLTPLYVGTDAAKLKADAPRFHAEQTQIPVLLVHADADLSVNVSHSRVMARALKDADKRYTFVELKGSNDALDRTEDRLALLNALDKFLTQNTSAPTP